MIIVTPSQMSQIDQNTTEKAGIPSLILMENAAHGTVNLILKQYGEVKDITITVIAGRGNNGGDAFAIARHLHNKGAKVRVFMAGKSEKLKDGTWVNYNVLENIGIAVNEIIFTSGMEYFTKSVRESKIIIDGLFGIGLNREVEGIDRKIIDIINTTTQKPYKNFVTNVVSLDVPSGINGENGKVMGIAIKANLTVSFGLLKLGLILHPAIAYTGKLEVVDISIPPNILHISGINTYYSEKEEIKGFIPYRKQNSHKGSFGKVLIISGTTGMTGAGCFAGMGALRSGAGLCYLAVPASLAQIYSIVAPECVIIPLDDVGGILTKDCMYKLANVLQSVDSVVVGPGISTGEHLTKLLEWILDNASVPVIFDADAITLLTNNIDILKKKRGPVILTPHPAELGRVMGLLPELVDENRVDLARSFAMEYGVTLVLKGNRTVIASAKGEVWINSTGDSGMATAGSGDVLAGIIGGFCAQTLKIYFEDNGLINEKDNKIDMLYKATVAGVFVHGVAGELASAEKGEYGVVASDVLGRLPLAIKGILE